jgi:hypothetical protein
MLDGDGRRRNEFHYTIAKCSDIVGVRVEIQVKQRLPSAPASLTEVLDWSVDEVGVWNGYYGICRSSNEGRAKTDFHDFTLHRINDDPVADFERAVEQYGCCPEKIGNGVLCCKRPKRVQKFPNQQSMR